MIRSVFHLSSKFALRSRFYSHTAPCCLGEAGEKLKDVLEKYRLAKCVKLFFFGLACVVYLPSRPCFLTLCVYVPFANILTISYQNELPSRFVKELLQAADENKDGFLEKHEFQHLLANIGAKDELSSEDLDEIVVEALGEDPQENPKIPMDRIKSILMGQFAKKS
jgi:hypothetical protein